MPRSALVLGALVAIGLAGCAVERSGLGGARDAAIPPRDGGVADVGLADVGAPDAPPTDGGGPSEDGGAPDGSLEEDAGAPDAGTPDAGTPDAGSSDAGLGCGMLLPTRDGLVLHYHAAFGVTTEAGEDGRPRVVTWLDQSGEMNHGAGRDVVYEPEGFGPSRPSIRTQGLDESHVELRNPSVDDFTIFVVMRTSYRRNAGNWYDSPCILGGDASGDQPDGALVLSDAKLGFTRQENGHGVRSSGRIDDGAPHVIATRRDGGSGDVTIRVDGADFASGSSTTGRIEQPSNWWIAAHADHARGRLDGSFAEVRVYARQLSDEELDVVERHLRCSWID